MKVKELKADGLSHELEVTVTANDINVRRDGKLAEVGKRVKIAGFRPGKVPLAILQKNYGRAIMGEVLEDVVNETSTKAMNDKKLRPAIQPKIEVKSFDEGKDLIYTINVEVLPTIKAIDLKSIALTRQTAAPGEKEISDALQRLAEMHVSTVKVEEARAAKSGDTVVIDFHGRTADDNVEHPGMHAHGHKLKLGSGQFIPGFEDQLTGKKAGDKVEVKVSFPKEYGAKDLAGRDAIFDVAIHEIHEDGKAPIDDAFAKNFGMETLDALKKAVGDQIQNEANNQSRMKLKKDLLDLLDEKHEVETPQGMLDMEYNAILQQISMERKQSGMTDDVTDEEKEELKDIAGRRVRLGLVLSEIGHAAKVQVADKDLQRAVIAEAQKYPGQEKQVFDFFAKNKQALDNLRAPVFEQKVVDYILEMASITDKPISFEELMKPIDEELTKKTPKKANEKKKASAASGESTAAKKPAAKKPAAKKAKA